MCLSFSATVWPVVASEGHVGDLEPYNHAARGLRALECLLVCLFVCLAVCSDGWLLALVGSLVASCLVGWSR